MNREEDKIFPGHGACELCGEIDPCIACIGVQYRQANIQTGDELLFEPAQLVPEKDNSIFTSVIKK